MLKLTQIIKYFLKRLTYYCSVSYNIGKIKIQGTKSEVIDYEKQRT